MPSFNGWSVIALPTFPPAPKSIEWELDNVVGSARSPFSLQQQIYQWNTSILRASVSWPFMTNANFTAWRAFLASLQGISNVFQLGDPQNQAPQNHIATGGTVTGSGQVGYTLNTSSSNLTPGDWIQIGYRLYLVTSVAGGSLGIWPNIRESPTGGTGIVITNTQGLFRLTKNSVKYMTSVEQGRTFSLTFEIEEAL
jgi:hypothetical protein